MPKEKEPPDAYWQEIGQTVDEKIADMVNTQVSGLLCFDGKTDIEGLVKAVGHLNITIAWVAKNNSELYSKYAFHVFKNHQGTYTVVQGVEVPTSF